MNFYDKIDDTRAQNGIGTQLNIWDDKLKKFKLLMPLETVPSVIGSTNTVEVDLLTSSMITKIEGKKSVDDKDVTFLWHRDNLRRLREIEGKQCKFLVSYPDFTGWGFEGKISYKPDDASSDKLTGTFTIVANAVDEKETEDVRDMLVKTCFITSVVPSYVELSGSGSVDIALSSNVSGATFEAKSNSASVATASISSNKLTITGVAKGNAIVEVTSSSSDKASWTTTIAVTVL